MSVEATIAMASYRLSSDRAAAVSTHPAQQWIPVTDVPPPLGVKLLLINETAGVAMLGNYISNGYFTHWAPLPRMRSTAALTGSRQGFPVD